MRTFKDHGDRFFEPVQIVGGARSRAIIQNAQDIANVNDQFIVPRILLRVRPQSLIQTTLVIEIRGGQKFLVCDHGADAGWNTHLLLPCDRTVVWARTQSTIDTVTGLPRSGGPPQTIDTPWVYWERPVRPPNDQVTRMQDVDYVVATGAPVQLGDTVDGHTIVRRDISMGITILGVRA